MAKPKRMPKLRIVISPAETVVPGLRLTSERPAQAYGATEIHAAQHGAHAHDATDPELLVRTTIARQLDLRPSDITGDVHLQIDLGADDAQLTQLLHAMGEALDARFPDDFLDGVHTVAELTAAIRVSLSLL